MYSEETVMDLESTLEADGSNGEFDCASNDSSQNGQLQGSLTKSHEPSCKRLKRSSALLRRSITNFNGNHDQTNTQSSSTINSNSFTNTETTAQRNLNEGFEKAFTIFMLKLRICFIIRASFFKAFDSIQLSSGPRMTPPIVILTDLTTKCIKSRRLI